jgi:hypothetical protein
MTFTPKKTTFSHQLHGQVSITLFSPSLKIKNFNHLLFFVSLFLVAISCNKFLFRLHHFFPNTIAFIDKRFAMKEVLE